MHIIKCQETFLYWSVCVSPNKIIHSRHYDSIWIRLKITLSVNTVGDFETFFGQCFLDILDSESIDQLPV